MSQTHSREHPSFNNMDLWQQQLMYNKMLELQRHQQCQQLDQEARQQSSLSHLSVSAKSAAHLPRVMNEVSANDTSNNMWPSNSVRGMSMMPNNSQMLFSGNMNCTQASVSLAMCDLSNGHILPDNHSQALRSMGFMPQQLDQSLHGMPASGNRPFANQDPFVNQCSQLFGMSNDGTNLMTKAACFQTEKVSDPSNNFQTDHCFPEQDYSQDTISVTTNNFQGEGVLGNDTMQIFSSDVTSGNYQQVNHMQDSLQIQEFPGGQVQNVWSGNLQEKPPVHVGTSTGVSSLDPTEEKILFGTNDDDNWGASNGGSFNSFIGGYPHGHPSQSEYLGAFPSIQSGSWSALMQEAVQASSSDQVIHEEWSGLNFQKAEQPMLMHSNVFDGTVRQLAAWNESSLQSASFSTSRLPSQTYDAGGDPNLNTVPNFQHTFKSSHGNNNGVPAKVPIVSFQLSTEDKIQFLQNQEQKQYLESGLQLQMPVTNRIWTEHTYDPTENNSADAQFKSQNIAGVWNQQENIYFSTANRQHSYGPNGSSTSSLVAPDGDGTSLIHGTDDNVWKLGASHVNPNCEIQPLKSNLANSHVQTEGSLNDNSRFATTSNVLNLTQEMNQQGIDRYQVVSEKKIIHDICGNSQGNENMGSSQNQPSRKLQTWETSINSTNKRLANTYDRKNEHLDFFSGKGYSSSQLNHGQDTNYIVAAEENPALIDCQRSFIGSQKHSTLSGEKSERYFIPPSHPPKFQGLADVVFQGVKSAVTKYVGNSQFENHDVLNKPMDVVKVNERIANGAKELQPRDSIHASNVSFDVIAAQSFENKRISQFSQNMFELLHKVDQSRDDNEIITPVVPAEAAAVVTASRPHFSQPSTLHGFGLHFSTPSQSVPLPNFEVSPQTINYRQPLGKEAGDQDQLLSTPTVGSLPHESYQVENWINTSNVSGQEHKGTSGLDQKKMLPVIPSDFPYVGDQLQGKQEQCPPGIKYLLEQQQDKLVMNSGGHEALDETISNYLGNQANPSILVRNSMLLREPPVAHNGDAADQSVQISLPILAGTVPPSLAVPTSDTHESAYLQEMTHTKATGAVSSLVKSSGQHSPVVETRSGSLSNISGMSQQAGFSKMLHHVWANLSAQQRLAGLQPHRVASNILQSIINHGRDASSWGLQMADSRGNQEENAPTEVGSSFINSQDRDHQTIGNSFKPKHAENADGALSATTPQGLERISSFFCRDSNVSIPSLVQHHQDIDKEKSRESSGFHPQVVHSPVTNTAPCRGDVCFPAHISVPSDSQQQNYSLLHQMQAIKDADSDSSMTLGKRLKGAGISSNASNMEQSAGQIFVHRQNELFRVPADGKQSSFPSDVKTLSFALKDNKRHTQISSVAEHHDLHDHMHSPDTSSSASLISGNEHYRSSPQMTLSLFEKYMTYKNDMAITKHDRDHFCGSMESSPIVEQITDSSKFGSMKQSTLASAMAANESSAFSLPSTIMDHSVGLRSKKRKSATSKLLPWHKEISQGLRRLQSTSITELAWAQAVNRLIEKVADDAESIEDGPSNFQPRRRLILTTQMIQQLLPAVPPAIINGEATSAYERSTYYVAKSTLADACSQISSFERDSCADVNLTINKVKSFELRDHIFSKIVEEFNGRSKKLESEFSRLYKKGSTLDVRLECQELERFSIVNRLVKFHGRSQTNGVGGSSASEAAPRRTLPQRYVTAHSKPENFPDAALCISL
ncbi:unnamed protein product [Musa acuminata subsp. burmannicoides]